MAQPEPAMSPQDALQTIAGLRRYRERLTARAAGIVWMVWGAALTLLAFQALFVEFPPAVEGPSAKVAGGVGLEAAGTLLCLAFAAMLTNAIWRAHALEAERTHPAWVPYAAGIGVALAISALTVTSNTLVDRTGGGWGSQGIAFAPLALLAAAGAATIAFLQRRRVAMLPGMLAALLLLNVFVLARFLDFSQGRTPQFWGAALLAWLPMLGYTAVGLWTIRKA